MKLYYSFLGAEWLGSIASGSAQTQPIANYHADALPINIAPTVALLPHTSVRVAGQPRMTKGHPCTLWDQVGNPSPEAAIVTVTLPALAGLKAFNLDDACKRTGPAEAKAGSTAGSLTIPLKPSSKIELASS